MRRHFRSTTARPPEPGEVIPFQRPPRPPASPVPEPLLRATEAGLRATDVYLRLLTYRLELARRANNPAGLGRLDAAALLRVTAASDALQSAAENALEQIDRDVAARARLVADTARQRTPDGR